jgi:predicted ester cyclase
MSLPEPTTVNTWASQPTGKSVRYNEIFIVRFEGGRIAETWGVVDVLSQMKQLGAIPV